MLFFVVAWMVAIHFYDLKSLVVIHPSEQHGIEVTLKFTQETKVQKTDTLRRHRSTSALNQTSNQQETEYSKAQQKKVSDQLIISQSNVAPSGPQAIRSGVKNQYLSDLRNLIEHRKKYPLIAKRLRQTGKVIVSFTLLRDGSITNVKVASPCPFTRLNHAARELILAIESYRAIPKELGLAKLTISQPIVYELN